MGLFNFAKRRSSVAPNSDPDTYVDPFDRPEFKKYYDLSAKINDARFPVERRLEFCEESLSVLPVVTSVFISDGSLPPMIACRDFGPEYYMRLGRWDDARRLITALNDCKAYYPEGNADILLYLEKFKSAANVAIQFLSANPGHIQRDIYRALYGAVDDEYLKHFIRCSFQIQKEPDGKTNRLYLAPPSRTVEISCPCSAKFRVVIREAGVSVHTCPKCGRQLRVNIS